MPKYNFDLPPVQLPELDATAAAQQQMTEQLNMEVPHTAAMPQAPPAAAQPVSPPMAPPAQGPPPAAAGQLAQPISTPITGTLPAADSDLIEKAWVKTAKAIIDQTLEDPYLQNKEITQVKVEYVKKRYNKDIKVNDSSKWRHF